MTKSSVHPKLKFEIVGLVLLVSLYVGVALAHAYLAPLTTGPDELAHYEYVSFIAGQGRLPLNSAERGQAGYKSDQPPLYHLVTALPASLVNIDGAPTLKRTADHPRRQLIERTRHAWGLSNTEDEQWPYRGEILRWHTGRWMSIFFGLATVMVTYFMARQLFAGRRLFALASGVIVAFVPRFALTGSMLNYETLVAFIAALFLWLLLQIGKLAEQMPVNNGRATDNRQRTNDNPRVTLLSFLLGLLAGLAIVTKLSAIILPLEIFIAFGLIARFYNLKWKSWAKWLLVAATGTLLPVGLWFGFVVAQFNTVAQDGWWTGLLRPLIAADSSDATTNRLLSFLTGGQAGFSEAGQTLDSGPPWEWAAVFFRTFWVVGIEGQQPGGRFGLVVAVALCAVAAAGLVVLWVAIRRKGTEHNLLLTHLTNYPLQLTISLLSLHLILPFVLPLIRYISTFSLADTAQGRHVLFLAAPAFAILMALGLSVAAGQIKSYTIDYSNAGKSETWQAAAAVDGGWLAVIFIPGIFLFGWSLSQLQIMTWAYLPPLPVTTTPVTSGQMAHPVNQPLTKELLLLEYDHQFDAEKRLVQVDLLWQATGVSPVDYLTEVHLLDAAGVSQRVWVGYPAAGRYPTRAWDPGDTVRDSLWLSTTGLDAGDYTLALNLKAVTTAPAGPLLQESLNLGTITISESTLYVFESGFPVSGAALGVSQFTVWQAGMPQTQPIDTRYRETISLLLAPLPTGWQREIEMETVLPTGELVKFAPVLQTQTQALFMVGPHWPTGDYHLVAAITPPEQDRQVAKSGIVAHVVNRWQRQVVEPEIAHRVEANFADQIKLLGYNLANTRAEPGGAIPLTLYWQGLDWMGNDYTIFTKLLRADDSAVYGGRDRLPREGYRTIYWAPDEIVTDPLGVPVDADAPDGIYYLNLGLYKEVNGQAVSLPLVVNGQQNDVTSLNIGPIKIGRTPPGITRKSASPQVVLNQPFGNPHSLTLLGYDLSRVDGQPPAVELTLYWQLKGVLPADYTTFVHLRNAENKNVAQKDQRPLNGAYPTSLWDTGEIVADEIVVPLPADLSGDTLQVVVGMYNFNTGQRLPVSGNPANEVKLTDVPLR